ERGRAPLLSWRRLLGRPARGLELRVARVIAAGDAVAVGEQLPAARVDEDRPERLVAGVERLPRQVDALREDLAILLGEVRRLRHGSTSSRSAARAQRRSGRHSGGRAGTAAVGPAQRRSGRRPEFWSFLLRRSAPRTAAETTFPDVNTTETPGSPTARREADGGR